MKFLEYIFIGGGLTGILGCYSIPRPKIYLPLYRYKYVLITLLKINVNFEDESYNTLIKL